MNACQHCTPTLSCLTALSDIVFLCVGNAELVEVVREGDLTALLLDVCELALCCLNRPELGEAILAQPAPGPGQLQAALSALQAVLKLTDSMQPLSLDTCCDLMLLLVDIGQVSHIQARQSSPSASKVLHVESGGQVPWSDSKLVVSLAA